MEFPSQALNFSMKVISIKTALSLHADNNVAAYHLDVIKALALFREKVTLTSIVYLEKALKKAARVIFCSTLSEGAKPVRHSRGSSTWSDNACSEKKMPRSFVFSVLAVLFGILVGMLIQKSCCLVLITFWSLYLSVFFCVVHCSAQPSAVLL